MTHSRIAPLILCKKCGGAGLLDGAPCPRCYRPELGWSNGIDPASFEGCCVVGDEAEHGSFGVVDGRGVIRFD
jgi:hypothetical protein